MERVQLAKKGVGTPDDLIAQGTTGEPVVFSDTDKIPPSALFIGTGGDVWVYMVDNPSVAVEYKNIQNGSWMPIIVTGVSASTTAANVVAVR